MILLPYLTTEHFEALSFPKLVLQFFTLSMAYLEDE